MPARRASYAAATCSSRSRVTSTAADARRASEVLRPLRPSPPPAVNVDPSPPFEGNSPAGGLRKLRAVKRKMQMKAAERRIQANVTERLSCRKRLRKQESRLRRLSKRVLDVRNYNNQDLDFVGLVQSYAESTKEANTKVSAFLN